MDISEDSFETIWFERIKNQTNPRSRDTTKMLELDTATSGELQDEYINYFQNGCRDFRLTSSWSPSRFAQGRYYPLSDEIKLIDRYPHWDYRRVKEVTRTRLHHNNINRDKGIEIPEAWMPIRSDNTAVDRYFSGPLREHFPPLIMPIIIWIETRQPSARFVLYESLTTKVVEIVLLSKSTLPPDEDVQCAV